MIEKIINLVIGKAGIAIAAVVSILTIYFAGRKHEKTSQENTQLKRHVKNQDQINEVIRDTRNINPNVSLSNDPYNTDNKI